MTTTFQQAEQATQPGQDAAAGLVDGPGSVAHAPRLPTGFSDTFSSRLIETSGARLHAVVGGDGPPLLLVGGWPQSWYAWRLTIPVLAIGGGDGLRDGVGATMRLVADDVQTAVLEQCGHFPAEETPEALLNVLGPFLAPCAAGR